MPSVQPTAVTTTTAKPKTPKPTTKKPTTAKPTTTKKPTTAKPTTKKPTTAKPAPKQFELSANGNYYIADGCSFNNKYYDSYNGPISNDDCAAACSADRYNCTYFEIHTYNDGSSPVDYDCWLFNPTTFTSTGGGKARVIPTFPYSDFTSGNFKSNITTFSCGFTKASVSSKPSFPSYTTLWKHFNPISPTPPSYSSVSGCSFSAPINKTKTGIKTADACTNLCYSPTSAGLSSCTHFNYNPSNSQCTLFNQPGSANFTTLSTGTTCGFMIGLTTQGAV